MYFDYTFGCKRDAFNHFNQLVDCIHETICMKWITYLNIEFDHLAFEFGGQDIWAKYKDQATSVISFKSENIYAMAILKVKS